MSRQRHLPTTQELKKASAKGAQTITGEGPPYASSYYPGCTDGWLYFDKANGAVYRLDNDQWYYLFSLHGPLGPDDTFNNEWSNIIDAEYIVNGEPLRLPPKRP